MPQVLKKDRELVYRVLDAVTFGMKPEVVVYILSVYLGRRAQSEIEAMFAARRKERRTLSRTSPSQRKRSRQSGAGF